MKEQIDFVTMALYLSWVPPSQFPTLAINSHQISAWTAVRAHKESIKAIKGVYWEKLLKGIM